MNISLAPALLTAFFLLTSNLTQAADPAERAARISASQDFESGRIVQLEADAKQGVWALTRNGKLYYCQHTTDGRGERLSCFGKEGPVIGDY